MCVKCETGFPIIICQISRTLSPTSGASCGSLDVQHFLTSGLATRRHLYFQPLLHHWVQTWQKQMHFQKETILPETSWQVSCCAAIFFFFFEWTNLKMASSVIYLIKVYCMHFALQSVNIWKLLILHTLRCKFSSLIVAGYTLKHYWSAYF